MVFPQFKLPRLPMRTAAIALTAIGIYKAGENRLCNNLFKCLRPEPRERYKEYRRLQKENTRSKNVVADQTLDIQILKEPASKAAEPEAVPTLRRPRPGQAERLRTTGLPVAGTAAPHLAP